MTQETQKNDDFMNKSLAPEEQQEQPQEAVGEDSVQTDNSELLENQKYKEKYYYLAAEYENALKRFEREKSNIIKFGAENILKDVLSSIDLFELTVQALVHDQDPKIKNILVGLEMIRKQMVDNLSKHGLERITSLNALFDPNFHEAVAQEINAEVVENTVIKEHQAGYKLNGRLLRAAKVVVSKKN